MKQKINLLITFSALILVALLTLHFYLIKTTYNFKIAEFHNEIKEKISNVTNDFSDVDSTFYFKKNEFYNQFAHSYSWE